MQVLLAALFFLFVSDKVRSQCYVDSGQRMLQILLSALFYKNISVV